MTPSEAYAYLGLAYGAPEVEVRRRFRLLSATMHPDKGGSHDEFLKLQRAMASLGFAGRSKDSDEQDLQKRVRMAAEAYQKSFGLKERIELYKVQLEEAEYHKDDTSAQRLRMLLTNLGVPGFSPAPGASGPASSGSPSSTSPTGPAPSPGPTSSGPSASTDSPGSASTGASASPGSGPRPADVVEMVLEDWLRQRAATCSSAPVNVRQSISKYGARRGLDPTQLEELTRRALLAVQEGRASEKTGVAPWPRFQAVAVDAKWSPQDVSVLKDLRRQYDTVAARVRQQVSRKRPIDPNDLAVAKELTARAAETVKRIRTARAEGAEQERRECREAFAQVKASLAQAEKHCFRFESERLREA